MGIVLLALIGLGIVVVVGIVVAVVLVASNRGRDDADR
jgi:hypothetical protein